MIIVTLGEFGCDVALSDGVLLSRPLTLDGSTEEWSEVSAPEDESFLAAVNDLLGSSFTMADFPGR